LQIFMDKNRSDSKLPFVRNRLIS